MANSCPGCGNKIDTESNFDCPKCGYKFWQSRDAFEKNSGYMEIDERTVAMIHTMAISSFTNFQSRFPALKKIMKNEASFKRWDFFMTVAGASVVVSINNNHETKTKIIKQLHELNEKMPEALNDLYDFYGLIGKTAVTKTDAAFVLGTWVLWNVKGAQPSAQEKHIVGTIGNYLVAFANDLVG